MFVVEKNEKKKNPHDREQILHMTITYLRQKDWDEREIVD